MMKRLAAALALFCAMGFPANAQKTKAAINSEITTQFQDNHSGAITPQILHGVTSDIVNSIMPTAPVVSGNLACFDGTTGLLQDCAALPVKNVLSPLLLNSGTLSCPTCATSTPSSSAILLASRTAAIAQDLHTFGVVQTGGYASAGDGGGAFFKNVGTSAFQDTFITGTPTLVGGSGYVNGTYLGVPLGGGVGVGCAGAVTVAGATVTAVSVVVPCPGYAVGDVLTASNSFLGGSGSGFSWTVTAISTPQASFTDSVGTHFQFITDQPGHANALQFGCKGDWNGTDAGATNNSPCKWSADAWGSYPIGASVAQVNGNHIVVPRGAYMTCGDANFGGGAVPYYLTASRGVVFSGVGIGGTTLVECAADSNTKHYIQLCDSNASAGQFGCKFEKMTINTNQVSGSTSGIAVIYSNSGQQFALGETLEIDAGNRSCIKYEIGKGGAANDIWSGIDCNQAPTATNPGFDLNSSGTQHLIRDSVIASSGGGGSAIAISNKNGRLVTDGIIDIEAYVTGLQQNVSTSGNNSEYRNVQQNSNNCAQAITLVSTNTPGNITFQNVSTACPKTILNGQSGGTDFTGNIRGPTMCVSGACNAAVP